ncbi:MULTISPECIES: efflux RND transporter periplasmic adaptor subunit [Zunongwangia]|jgi:HlyD family secretion protein|uniref:Efflux transporter, MFP component, RND family protein n=3 Tax=Zunongwangia profunda TaxID=398743 RepID=D5BDM4_ZUNPS|nr:efflux RND transporter periplasmic adaptor subunit [Zunongwangia profunda]ADF54930.1 efflux transporter, MFP component, RND family protein [Zunongwangia profunda SM-A87]MAG86718.1 efflux RND transporter periplasmic adaptor subunit [Flavobacteriaceae bacterium]MAS72610.1 efflux RND transporter periplasmic adaptor subunit [Zunongwangia sp.]MCC4226574.1 efflux RND transporter periplasmic adaptor subunit [Zunongwangia profunda]|tara:strand:+ start:425 stop:1678 length:1254 start_codon:yes stop_codon:yes gene_type:complete
MDIPIKKKRFTPQKIAMITGVTLLVGLIVFVLLSSSGSTRLNVEKERISINTVKKGIFQENIPVNGVVMPITTIYLDALEGGRVEEKFVEDGAMMKKGEPILRLSNTDLELSLVNQETQVYNLLTQMQRTQNASRENTIGKLNQLTEVKSSLREAERRYKLNKKLFEKGAVAEQEYLETRNNYNYQKDRLALTERVLQQDSISSKQENVQARESYEKTRKALELMRKKVEDLIVRAPVDGQLTSLDAEIGQSKSKGERLGQIDVISGYKVRVDVDEHYISRIYAGQQGSFNFDGKNYTLEIKKVYTQVANGRFQVDMTFLEEAPEKIRRGQTLQIRVALSQEKEAVLIPKGGFFQETGGNWIFKVSEDGSIAYKTDIQLGSQNTEYYEVLSGLEPGDQVITSSYSNYEDIQELVLKD